MEQVADLGSVADWFDFDILLELRNLLEICVTKHTSHQPVSEQPLS